MDKVFFINWLFKFIYVALITFLFAGFLFSILGKLGDIGISLIDHYMKRRQEAIDKMILEGIDFSKQKHFN